MLKRGLFVCLCLFEFCLGLFKVGLGLLHFVNWFHVVFILSRNAG